MLSSLRATVVAALALSAAASPHVSRSSAACANPKTIQSGTVPVGGVDILFETVACAGAVAPAADSLGGVLCILLGLFCPPKPVHVPQPITSTETVSTTETFTSTATVTSTASSVSATPTAPSVCGAACNIICEDLGDLPPISEDCQTLDNAVTILSGSINPTFVVQSLHQQVLTFGTCRYFFTNLASSPLEYCWSSLSTQASAAGAACFPPVNPFVPEGVCASVDSVAPWQVGASHS